jgi:hypothetical protein
MRACDVCKDPDENPIFKQVARYRIEVHELDNNGHDTGMTFSYDACASCAEPAFPVEHAR